MFGLAEITKRRQWLIKSGGQSCLGAGLFVERRLDASPEKGSDKGVESRSRLTAFLFAQIPKPFAAECDMLLFVIIDR